MMKKCRQCKVKLVCGTNWYRACARKNDYICSQCKSAANGRWVAANPEKVKAARLRSGIRPKGLKKWEWQLSRQEHKEATSTPCYYCRGPLDKTGVGLDRVNSQLGYTVHNVVPCCARCNRMKSDLLTVDEMLLLWAIRRGDCSNPYEGEHHAPDGMNWIYQDGITNS